MGNCLNCGQEITGNYCSNCGQKKYRRIDRKYIIEEAQYSLLHTNKGFLYSVKNILKNPGKTARDFIEGNRVNHYKPILLAFVLSGISAFIAYKLTGMDKMLEDMNNANGMSKKISHDYTSFTTNYNTFIMLALVPLYAFFTKISFRKWGHNYYEHVVMNAFIVSLYTIIAILIVHPLMYFFKQNSIVVAILSLSVFVVIPFLYVWFFKGFYSDKPLFSIIKRVVLYSILISITLAFLLFGLMMIYIIMNPEVIKEMQMQRMQKN